jgi:precorrin-6B methylase 2
MMKHDLKNNLKRFLLHIAPEPIGALLMFKHRNHIRSFERKSGLTQITKAFVERHGLKVLSGPFHGMAYLPEATGSVLVPKLLGSYEAELHGVLDQILETQYTLIVDIGCAEGYYAVGLALRISSAQIYAFDLDPRARKLCHAMARSNNVSDRITIAGKCDVEHLNALSMEDRALIICDCEGGEIDLLRPELIPGLASADILVELHDHLNSSVSISQLIFKRFNNSHEINLITTSDRDLKLYQALDFLDPKERYLGVCEFRPSSQQWAFLTSKLKH